MMTREQLLRLDHLARSQHPVELTDPEVLATDDNGNPAGVGVEDESVMLAGIVVARTELDAAGLRATDVPNLRVVDEP